MNTYIIVLVALSVHFGHDAHQPHRVLFTLTLCPSPFKQCRLASSHLITAYSKHEPFKPFKKTPGPSISLFYLFSPSTPPRHVFRDAVLLHVDGRLHHRGGRQHGHQPMGAVPRPAPHASVRWCGSQLTAGWLADFWRWLIGWRR